MELVKPDPLIIDGIPHYSLTSYDPLTIEVDVPYVSEGDLDRAMMASIMQNGGTLSNLNDDAWIREHFEGINNARELRDAVRTNMKLSSERLAEEQKVARCSIELCDRLEQRVPSEYIAAARRSIDQAFAMSLEHDGITEEQFYSVSGMRRDEMEKMLELRARIAAETQAALSCWVEHFNIELTDEEAFEILGIDPQEVEKHKAELQMSGELNEMRSAARRTAAMQQIVSDCHCTYVHEGPSDDSGRPNLKLV